MENKITDQTELAVLARKGDEAAKTALVRLNEKFVIGVARQYVNQGMELDDLVQEGQIGLLKAIEKYDPKVGTKFLTYASWWIKQSILQSLAEYNRQVRLPANRINILEQYKKTRQQLAQDYMRDPTQEEILDMMGLEEKDLYEQSSMSYHIPIYGEDLNGTMLDILPNDMPSPDHALMQESMKYEMDEILKHLKPREQTVIKMLYGIGYERTYTLEEVGEKLKLTRERIRQIKEHSLKNLRRLNRRKRLENLKDR